eukprot:tig00021015_g17174.t1
MKIFACFEACSPARLRLAILDEAPRDFASRSSMKIFACFEACSPARLRLAILDEDLACGRPAAQAATFDVDAHWRPPPSSAPLLPRRYGQERCDR